MFEVQFENLDMVDAYMLQICFIEVLLGGNGYQERWHITNEGNSVVDTFKAMIQRSVPYSLHQRLDIGMSFQNSILCPGGDLEEDSYYQQADV